MTPWNILVSAESLINFMSGYTIWLAPISGILIADYWIVHRQVVSVPDMYRPDGIYAYNKYGTNWRAVVAFVVGFAPLLPGFAKSVSAPIQSQIFDFYTRLTTRLGECKSWYRSRSHGILLLGLLLWLLGLCGTPCSLE